MIEIDEGLLLISFMWCCFVSDRHLLSDGGGQSCFFMAIFFSLIGDGAKGLCM